MDDIENALDDFFIRKQKKYECIKIESQLKNIWIYSIEVNGKDVYIYVCKL